MNKRQILTAVYRPPNHNPSAYLYFLEKYTVTLLCKYPGYEFTLIGDLNIDYLKKDCRHVKALKILESNHGLAQIIKSPTRVTAHNSTLIDLCFTNISNVFQSGTLNYNLSDHLPILS